MNADYTGTVIRGTLRSEDLLPAFFELLEEIAPATAELRKNGTWAEDLYY